MLNHALLAKREDLNTFTLYLAEACRVSGSRQVTLRNQTKMDVQYMRPGEDGNEHPLFYTPDWEYCWNADGSSVVNKDFDIVEF